MAPLPYRAFVRARGPFFACGITAGTWRWLHTPKPSIRCDDSKSKDAYDQPKSDAPSFLDKVASIDLAQPLQSLPQFKQSLASINLPELLPSFASLSDAFASLTKTFAALHAELVTAPGSQRAAILSTASDSKAHPEVDRDAVVRIDHGLCQSERDYVRNRRHHIKSKFANLINVPEDEVDVRDVPVIAVAGSGGGYRAMVNSLASVKAMQDSGVWDCVTYVSAVSGSCWALNVLYTIGGGDSAKAIEHVKERIKVPFMDPSTLEMLIDPKTSKYLLSGIVLKEASESGDVSLVDIYGTLVSARLFVPDPCDKIVPSHLKISSQKALTDLGRYPLPLYCAVSHQVPLEAADDPASASLQKKNQEKENDDDEADRTSQWLWAEISPYELSFADLGASIPTWAVGRQFKDGQSINRVPETSLTIFTGIFASAFCATLFNYYKEIKPILAALPYFDTTEAWILQNFEQTLDSIHPFPPAELPNFLNGLGDRLPPHAPRAVSKLDTLGFMDAGANLNIPYIPLFRRDCDIVMAFDASADSQELWFSRAQEYAHLHDYKKWPKVELSTLFPSPTPTTPGENAASKVDEAKSQEGTTAAASTDATSSSHVEDDKAQPSDVNAEPVPSGSAPKSGNKEPPLGRCNIWLGASSSSETTTGEPSLDDDASSSIQSRNDSPTVDDVEDKDGIVLMYYPLKGGKELENPSEVWSTWKFEYKEEETQALADLAQANFNSSREQLITVLKGVWKRKRKQRLEREASQ